MYAQNKTRPDISFATSTLARFGKNPSEAHWEAGLKVLNYLQGTSDMGPGGGKN
jgi:hypothetical protein